MKIKSLLRLIVVLALCLSVLCVFTACKDDEIYAGSDDFQSYPDYWNDFNDDSGDIYIPDTPNDTTSGDSTGSSNDGTTSSEEEDWTANFTEDEDEDTTSSVVDTDKDGTPDDTDPDDNNNGTPDDEEKPDYGNQGPLVFF